MMFQSASGWMKICARARTSSPKRKGSPRSAATNMIRLPAKSPDPRSCSIFGRPFSSLESQLEQTHPDDRGIVSKAIQDTLDGQEPYIIHYRIVRPDGTSRIISSQREAETDGAGNVVRMIGIVQDVTERKQLEEKLEILNADLAARADELEAANVELDAFASTVTHDLRKPLTVINGYCQVILEFCTASLDDSCTEYLRKIYDTTLLMDQLIDTLLRFSSPGRSEIVQKPVNLSEIAHIIAAELRMSNPQRRVTFAIADEVKGKGDAKLLRVALENLLGNAWKFTAKKEEAVIEFGVTEIEGEPAYFVRDDGPGFDMADAGKLFIPFQRFRTDTEGHGIGLATVERIIRRHGGRVWAEGEVGKGAIFYFTLPFIP